MMAKFIEQARKSTRDAFAVIAGVALLISVVLLLMPDNLESMLNWDWSNPDLRLLVVQESLFLPGAILFGLCAYGLETSRRWAIHGSLLLSTGVASLVLLPHHQMNVGFFLMSLLMLVTLPFSIGMEIGYLSGATSSWRH
jgi:hypothetical protein